MLSTFGLILRNLRQLVAVALNLNLRYLMQHGTIVRSYYSSMVAKSECVRLHFTFFRLSKIWSMLHHGSVGQVQTKNTTICFHLLFLTSFFFFFFLFFIIKLVLLSFSFLFWWSIKFPQQNINQLERRMGGPKLSVELYVTISFIRSPVPGSRPSCYVTSIASLRN